MDHDHVGRTLVWWSALLAHSTRVLHHQAGPLCVEFLFVGSLWVLELPPSVQRDAVSGIQLSDDANLPIGVNMVVVSLWKLWLVSCPGCTSSYSIWDRLQPPLIRGYTYVHVSRSCQMQFSRMAQDVTFNNPHTHLDTHVCFNHSHCGDCLLIFALYCQLCVRT